MTASLFFPILPWVLQLGVIAYAIAVALYLTSTGDPVYKTRYINNQTCDIGYEVGNIKVYGINIYLFRELW